MKTNQNFTLWAGNHATPIIETDIPNLEDSEEILWIVSHRSTDDKSDALLIKKQTGGDITVDGQDIIIHIDPADTRDIVPGAPPRQSRSFHHEAKIWDTDGKEHTIMTGTMTVKSVVARGGE